MEPARPILSVMVMQSPISYLEMWVEVIVLLSTLPIHDKELVGRARSSWTWSHTKVTLGMLL